MSPVVSPEEVLAEIQRIVAVELELERPVQPEDELLRDVQLDSLGLLTVAVGLENRFRVVISNERALWVRTARDLAVLVSTLCAEREYTPKSPTPEEA